MNERAAHHSNDSTQQQQKNEQKPSLTDHGDAYAPEDALYHHIRSSPAPIYPQRHRTTDLRNKSHLVWPVLVGFGAYELVEMLLWFV